MSGLPHIVLHSTPLHLIRCGNNHQNFFYSDEDYLVYFEWLEEYALNGDCSIQAFVLMTNHVHLLITPHSTDSANVLMKRLG